MNKQKKQASVDRLREWREAKFMWWYMGWMDQSRKRGMKTMNRAKRRHQRIKAERLAIPADCPTCRNQPIKAGLKGYHPVDDYVCRQCRWTMRGGRH